MAGKAPFLMLASAVLALCIDAQPSIDEMIMMAAEEPAAMDLNQRVMNSEHGEQDVLIELDMLFPREYIEQYRPDVLELLTGGRLRLKRKAIRPTIKRWTNKIVPYSLASGTFSYADRAQINAAIAEWEQYTCIDFRQATGRGNRIHLYSGGGCSSYIGMNGGTQYVSLARGCRTKGVIVHELGHAIGFFHEQSRPDRDRYIRVNFQNIGQSVAYNFKKASTSEINYYGVPYDLTSVMHYGAKAFSTNGRNTITTLDSRYQNVIGRRGGLSFRDVKLANLMYGCSSSCAAKTCPGEGYVGKDCQCWCPSSSGSVPAVRCGGVTQPPVTNRPVTNRPVTNQPVTTTRRPTTSCVDQNQYCGSWARSGECQKNPRYMLVNCKRSCGTCSATCVDNNAYCSSWAQRGECSRNPGYMHRHCKRSCRRCGSSASSSSCIDFNSGCSAWARAGYCATHTLYMKIWCRRSCNSCQ